MPKVISVENLSKSYRLGQIDTGTFTHDLAVWWAKVRGKPNPMSRIGDPDHGNRDGDEIWALRDVSFTVEQGEVLGIIGRNGAGKSTLLKILSRVTAPTSGRIRVRGRVASLLEVGTGFHPDLTGRENVYLNGAILGMNKREIERKFDEIVEFAEVEKFIDTPVKRYSSGMYVRLAFAVAAHLDPEILVVDEVLAVGDAEFQKKCLGKMNDVANEGRTVLFVSHNMASMSSLCTSGILMQHGSSAMAGTIADTIEHYLSIAASGEKIVEFPHERITAPVMTRACIKDEFGRAITSIPMGQPFGVQVEFKSPFPISNPVLGIRIQTPSGNSVIGVKSDWQNRAKLASDVREGVFNVMFPKANINQGIYYISLALSDDTQSYDRQVDILKFEVTPVDVFGTGKIPTAQQSHIFTEGKWSLVGLHQVGWS
jgi:lipopolysaccharide transport system ATP-binding protein